MSELYADIQIGDLFEYVEDGKIYRKIEDTHPRFPNAIRVSDGYGEIFHSKSKVRSMTPDGHLFAHNKEQQ